MVNLKKSSVTLRRRYEPLNVVATIVVAGSTTALAQVYDSDTGEYAPDWSINNLVLGVDVRAWATDGSLEADLTAKDLDLASIVWRINDKTLSEIRKDSTWTNKVTDPKSASTDDRGQIAISRNMLVGEALEISFEGKIPDKRTGQNIIVRPKSVTITCAAKTPDRYTLAMIDVDVYAPFSDKQTEIEWAEANGKKSQFKGQTLTERDKYLRTYPISLTKGGKVVAEKDYTLKLKKDGSGTADTTEATLTKTGLTLDLRMVERATYTVTASVGNSEVASGSLCIMRRYAPYECQPAHKAAVSASDEYIRNEAKTSANGHLLLNPEAYLRMVWESEANGVVKRWNEGRACTIPIAETGMADSVEVSVLTAPREALSLLASGGKVLTADGKILIV